MAKAAQIILATHNAGKVRELAEPLGSYGLEVFGLEAFGLGEIEENGTSFEENALIKARTASKISGLTAIADDSGLMVAALGGEPGIYSARYAHSDDCPPYILSENFIKLSQDERNIIKLLHNLKGIKDRRASFCCVMCAVHPDENIKPLFAKGTWQGKILQKMHGSNGFGYDPIFFDEYLKLSAAQMPRELKMSRSHRAKALKELLAQWPDFWAYSTSK